MDLIASLIFAAITYFICSEADNLDDPDKEQPRTAGAEKR